MCDGVRRLNKYVGDKVLPPSALSPACVKSFPERGREAESIPSGASVHSHSRTQRERGAESTPSDAYCLSHLLEGGWREGETYRGTSLIRNRPPPRTLQ